MFAQLEYNPCHGAEVMLVIYRSAKDAKDDEARPLMHVPLTNEQLSEFVIMAKIKPVNMDR